MTYGTDTLVLMRMTTFLYLISRASEKSFLRVFDSPRGGFRVLSEFLDDGQISFGDFFGDLSPEFNLSLFSRFLIEERAAGDDQYLVEAQGAFSSPKPAILEWLLCDGLYDATLNAEDEIVYLRTRSG